jgi:inhibitor of cysteine peptidase
MYMQKHMVLFAAIVILSSVLTMNVFAQSEEMSVNAQQEFDISLPSNPSTGYQWMVREISDESIVKYINSTFVSSGNQMPGSGGTEVLTFWAEKEGTATITLQYLRSWEPDQPAETRTIMVTVAGGSMEMMPGPIYLVAESGPEGKYNVTVLWFSNDIGQENNFSIRVYDTETNEEIYDGLTLDFSIAQGDKVLVSKQMTGPAFPSTEETQFAYGDRYAFESEGSYSLVIGNINGSGESVEFPMQVTPEFGPIVILAVAISALAGVVAAGRFASRQ